jgi:hypothetical protein
VAPLATVPGTRAGGGVDFDSASAAAARFAISTEPSPVTRSKPGPAEYPIDPVVQLGVPIAHGTMLLPAVMSWKAVGEVCANRYSIGFRLPSPGWLWAPLASK